MIYRPILSHPVWLMIGVIEYNNRDSVTSNWDWIHQLARKDCLHNFWQIYRHTREHLQFRWCCVSCQTSFVMQQKENLLEEE